MPHSILRVAASDEESLVGTITCNQQVAYPCLRVESEELEVEELRDFPPGLLRPASIEPLDLQQDGHLSPLWTAKAAHLAKLAPQLPIGAFQQRGGTYEFACHPFQLVVRNGLFKVTL